MTMIENAANEIQKLRSEGETPIVTLEYGTGTLTDLMEFFEGNLGVHTTIIDVDNTKDVEKSIDGIRKSMGFLDREVVVFVNFKGGSDEQNEVARYIASNLDGHCILVKKIWKKNGIEIGKI